MKTDKLHHRTPPRSRNRPSQIPRLTLHPTGALTRPPYLHQRAPWNERLQNKWWICFLAGQPRRRWDCSVPGALVAAGAVLYGRTTQPQSVMHLETSSNIYGVTVNPWNTDLTPGGSSGGESALLAMRGSVLVS
jgi:hypothetical protein